MLSNMNKRFLEMNGAYKVAVLSGPSLLEKECLPFYFKCRGKHRS